MYKTIELLAPAKDLQTGIAALKHGADAVYIAANKFGAREKAGNSVGDIKKLVDFAHQYFARVYVTVNTIIYDNEINEVKELILELYSINVDAIIIQDFAILAMDIPPIAIHASTQMHNNTPEKVKFLEQCGLERVVLPRELSISEIKSFRESTNIELESFVHGALCVCYSGQCYMSQAVAERSANRGACAQPCRSAYDLIDSDGKVLVRNKHLLSLKDLNLSDHIHQLIDAGVSSFKIEGRMKDIAYVKNTVAFYSSILNKIISTKPGYRRLSSGQCEYSFTPDPERSFNRGFTHHFVDGRTKGQATYHSQKSIGKALGKIVETGSNWFRIATEETVNNGDGLCYYTENGELKGFLVNSALQDRIVANQPQEELNIGMLIYRNSDFAFEKTLKNETSTRKISASISVKQKSSKLVFKVTDEDLLDFELIVEDSFEAAKNVISANNNIVNQLSKSGETIFHIDNIDITDVDNPKHIPISQLNSIRRDLLEGLQLKRTVSYNTRKRVAPSTLPKYPILNINYKGNVANTMSKEFLRRCGVKTIDNALENEKINTRVELMVTKYCIKYEIGLCPSKQNAKPTKDLFLKDNNNTYPLSFDCKNCQMIVLSQLNKK